MSSRRSLSWSAALRDMKDDRTAPRPVREERLNTTAGLRGSPAMALSAWRGQSARRYVVTVNDLNLDVLEAAGDAVCIAVARDDAGIARVIDAATGLNRTEAVEWLCRTVKSGGTELHIHRLAESAAQRAAIVADLTAF